MSSFEKSWSTLRDHEGKKFTNHSWDPGGATKYGITLRYAQQVGTVEGGKPGIDLDLDDDGDIDAKDIQLLDEPKAMEVYNEWWTRHHYGRIVDQTVATKAMDLSINMGPRGVTKKGTIIGAHILIQRAVNSCGYKLVEDGWLGNKSFEAINDCDARELLFELCERQKKHYENWLAGFTTIPGDREVAREGLLKRAAWPFVKGGYLNGHT